MYASLSRVMFGVIKKIKPARLDSLSRRKGVNSRRILIVFYAYLLPHNASTTALPSIGSARLVAVLVQWVETAYYITYFKSMYCTLRSGYFLKSLNHFKMPLGYLTQNHFCSQPSGSVLYIWFIAITNLSEKSIF